MFSSSWGTSPAAEQQGQSAERSSGSRGREAVTPRTGRWGVGAESRLRGFRDRRTLALRAAGFAWEQEEPTVRWRGVALLRCGCACAGVCMCVCACECMYFTGLEQQIMHLHTCMSACEHLCKHLYHGTRMQLPGHKRDARRHLESCARGGCHGGARAGRQPVLRARAPPARTQCTGYGPRMSPGRQSCPFKISRDEAIPQGVPNPGPCEYVTFHGVRDFAKVIKLGILRRGGYSGLLGGPNVTADISQSAKGGWVEKEI